MSEGKGSVRRERPQGQVRVGPGRESGFDCWSDGNALGSLMCGEQVTVT